MAKRKPAAEPETTAAPPSAGYTVLARRYRPQQFGDLVGQEAVAQALGNALQTGRVAHAYLFTGARGVGKTSTARILAKALNCVNGPTTTPCDQCDICRSIASGEDMDVLEIDGASNRGIDEVREVRQNVQYRPSRACYKIYIIDEVHMLTTPAFNALLKTLEEPPAHVKFIFATTEVQKIPVTILSRCQRFDFGGINLPGIVERLRQIVAREGMRADDDALELVARRAGGSMRDAQSLLDQLLAFGSENLTADAVHQLLGTAHEERVAALAAAVLDRDPAQALSLLGDVVNQGQQLGELLDQLVEYWRDLMVVNCAGTAGQALSVSGPQRGALKDRAGRLKLDTILAGLDILVSAKMRLKGTGHGRVLLEMTLVRLAQLDDLVPLTQLAQWVRDGVPRSAATPAKTASSAAGVGPGEKKKVSQDAPDSAVGAIRSLSEASLPEIWQQLSIEVGFTLAAELRKSLSPAISGPNCLVIRFPQRYNVQGGALLDPVRRGHVEQALSQLLGQPATVRLEFVPDEEARPTPLPSPNGANGTPTPNKQAREELRKLPLVQKARDALGADIISFDPDFGTAVAASKSDAEDTEEE